MPINDAEAVKKRILNFLERNGASLPVHIAKEAGMDMIFTSAFLSELISHDKIKVSDMKIGTSPLYFIPGNESGLEKFSDYLKGKEREAFNILKKENFLEDQRQEPAIRIALRSLKDFAKPFEKDGKLIWRYYLINEDKYITSQEKVLGAKPDIPIKKEEVIKEEIEIPEVDRLEIEGPKAEIHEEEIRPKKKVQKKKSIPKKASKEKSDKFFNKVKEFIIKNGFEILDILSFNKKDLLLKVKKDENESIIAAYNKKKISEKDLLDAYKKAATYRLNYSVFSLGETPKKMKGLIDAMKKMDSFEKIE